MSRSSDGSCDKRKVADETDDGALGPSKEVSQAVRRRSSKRCALGAVGRHLRVVVLAQLGGLSGRLPAPRSESDDSRRTAMPHGA